MNHLDQLVQARKQREQAKRNAEAAQIVASNHRAQNDPEQRTWEAEQESSLYQESAGDRFARKFARFMVSVVVVVIVYVLLVYGNW